MDGHGPHLSSRDARRTRRAHRRARVGVQLHRWHRRAGVFGGVFLFWLAISGMLLNEAPTLGLDQARIGWPWLMRIYGLHETKPDNGYSIDGHWLVAVGDEIRWDGRIVSGADPATPIGAVLLDGVIYVASADRLTLLKASDGSRVDELGAESLPATPLRRIGQIDGILVLESGLQTVSQYRSPDALSWQLAPASEIGAVTWSQAGTLPPAAREAATLRPSLPLNRVLADVHSGRIAGPVGVKLIDLVGLAAIILSVTGLWALLRRRRRELS